MIPLISIIIPTLNRAHLISNTLDSVISQNYNNWECIIIDDGSLDNTKSIVKDYRKKDGRIKYYARPENWKKGASACRNYGLELSKGILIQFLDDDDLLDKNKLAEQVKAYSGNNEVLTCKWGGFNIEDNLKSRFKYTYASYRSFKNGISLLTNFGLYNEFFPLHVYLIPRSLIAKAGNWNEEINNNDDAEFFTRILLNASGVRFVGNTQVYYRYGQQVNLSSLNNIEKIESAIKSWKLIDTIVKAKFPNKQIYVKRAIWNLYEKVKVSHPDIIKRHSNFFLKKKNYDNMVYSLYRKVRLLSKI